MLIPNRHDASGKYRYGFNGMEKDDEVKGDGNSFTTEFRQYDPRIGRWLTVDPAYDKYPDNSPYVAFNNNPLFFTDPFGDDPPERLSFWNRVANYIKGKSHINKANKEAVETNSELCYTYNGNIPVVINPETRDAKVFLNKKFKKDNNAETVDIQFLNTEEMLYSILEDYGGIIGVLQTEDNIQHLGVLNLGSTTIYDDVEGVENENNIYSKITFNHPKNNVIELGLPKIKVKWKSGNINAVYMRMKLMPDGQRLPYIGKAFNVISRYSSLIRNSSNLKTVVSKISDKDLLRAVEQKFIDYVRFKTNGNSGNIRNAMNKETYKNYSQQVDDLLKGTDWKKIIDKYFNF